MTPRLTATLLAATAALALAGCKGGSGNNLNEAAANLNQPLPKIDAPNNADWTQRVEETAEGGYRMGNPDAPVKLVEYASIGCHVCADFSDAAHEKLTNDYVKSGQVSWEYRPFMLFPTDPGMFLLLRCQGPQPFFALAEQLYATQQGDNGWMARTRTLTEAQLQQMQAMPPGQQAAALTRAMQMDQFFRQNGLPQARIDACLTDAAALQKLADITKLGQREGVSGTPSFFINGERVDVTAWSALEPRLRAAIGQ